MKYLITTYILTIAFPLLISAQKNLLDYSFTDSCTVTINTENSTLKNLTDKDDNTIFEIRQFTGNEVVSFIMKEAIVLKGINIVSGDNPNADLYQAQLYGSNDAKTWVLLKPILGITYSGRKRPHFEKSLDKYTNGYSYFQLAFKKSTGTSLRIADIQLLGYPVANQNIAIPANGILTSSQDITGETLQKLTTEPIILSNVKSNYGIDNAWLQYEFNVPTAISGYALRNNDFFEHTKRPRAWELLASNDKENWLTIDYRSNYASDSINYNEQQFILPGIGANINYSAVADSLLSVLMSPMFKKNLSAGGFYFIDHWNADPEKINDGYNYWWMAHAVDNFIDVYERTGAINNKFNAQLIRQGMINWGGKQNLWNSFYDDMEWMALASIRAYQTFHDPFWLTDAKQLFEWIKRGWDDIDGGGIHWNQDISSGKNSCSNAPAMIVAARLYEITNDPDYLVWATKIHDWMMIHSRFDDGLIKDSPENNNRDWAFTYNQGTWVGGLMELYKITHNPDDYDTAVGVIDKCIDSRWYSPDGIMGEDGGGDGGLFKGIYIRYITQWITSGLLDAERQFRYTRYIMENAQSCYLAAIRHPEFMVSADWKDQRDHTNSYYASVAMSGLMLFECANKIKQAGLLNDNFSVKNDYVGKKFRYYRLKITSNEGDNDVSIQDFKLFGLKLSTTGLNQSNIWNGITINNTNNGFILIDCDNESINGYYNVYSFDGRKILTRRLSKSNRITLSHGIYMITIELGKNRISRKLIVK